MSGGPRYWNDETQRWEDGDGDAASTGSVTPVAPAAPMAPVTPPPPPDSLPEWASGTSGETGTSPTALPAPPVSPPPGPAPWPAASTWHGPSSTDTVSGGWPPAEPVGVPGPPGVPAAPRPGISRRLVWSVVVGAAVVGVAVSLVLTLVVDPGKGDGKGGRTVAASASAPGSSGPTDVSPSPSVDAETVSPSASAPELPAGSQSHEDPEGFRIAYPDGWTRSTVPSAYGMDVVNYRSADSEHRLQVYQVEEGSPDASFELYLSDGTPKPDGFRKIALEKLDDGTFTASRLEYTADSLKGEPDIGTWHVYDERFVAEDGNIYAIAAYGPDVNGGDDELALLNTALAWFCPDGTDCRATVD